MLRELHLYHSLLDAASPSLNAALRVDFLPITGPLSPALIPRSVSRSMVTRGSGSSSSALVKVHPYQGLADSGVSSIDSLDSLALHLSLCFHQTYDKGCFIFGLSQIGSSPGETGHLPSIFNRLQPAGVYSLSYTCPI